MSMAFDPSDLPDSHRAKATPIQGGCIPTHGGPSFTMIAPANQSLPVVIAVPHAGRVYPQPLIEKMRDPARATIKLEDRYVDLLGERIAAATGVSLLVAHAPRAMLDLNRSCEDIDWSMIEGSMTPRKRNSLVNRRARSGLGLVPRRVPADGEIWKGLIDQAELDARIDGIHRPYHHALASELARIRDMWGAALLIDLHSMPPLKPRANQPHIPEFVVGNRFGASCRQGLTELALRYFETRRRPVALNRPYSGGYVLDRHASPINGIHAIQLEVCRSLYLDQRLVAPREEMDALAEFLAGFVQQLGDKVRSVGDLSWMSQAAE